MKRIAMVALLCLLLNGCTYTKPNIETMDEQTENVQISQWNPFVGSFEYDADRIFLQSVVYPEITEYNLAYKHRDGTVEVLVDNVSEDTTYRLINQRLFYIAFGTLYARDLPGGENCIFHIDSKKYTRVVTILDIQDGWLYCGAEKRQQTSDPTSLDGKILVGTRIFVSLDFEQYYEETFEE